MSTPTPPPADASPRNPDFINEPMNPRIKAQWTAALRSGDYQQTTSYLMEPETDSNLGGFCCLGVLCDLAVKEGIIPPPIITSGSAHYGVVSPDASTLPLEVMEWAGLQSKNPEMLYGYDEDSGEDVLIYKDLADINDNQASFEEIAVLIEEQL